MKRTISERDVKAEWLAFDLAAEFDIDLTQHEGKPLIGWQLYEYVIDALIKRDKEACVEPLRQYAKHWHEAYDLSPIPKT
jgi:hypothetical protein